MIRSSSALVSDRPRRDAPEDEVKTCGEEAELPLRKIRIGTLTVQILRQRPP
jgi:hypothetical protein